MNKETNKCNARELKTGEKLSRLSYLTVVRNAGSAVIVRNEQNVEWSISHDIVSAECYSADQYQRVETMTRTELVAKFNSIGDAVYTVNFNKQPKVEDAFEAIANRGKLLSNKEMKKALAEEMKGEERTLVGYTVARDIALGRSMVVELGNPIDDRIRQVDHRTLNWFVCMNVRYEVKGK